MDERKPQQQDETPAWQRPVATATVDDKPAVPHKKSRDEMTPAEKAADTRAKHERAEKREAKQAEKAAAEAEVSPDRRTWTCPHCGRGTTLATTTPPDGPMLCLGCGLTVDGWLPPGSGHGEPELQTAPKLP